MKIQNLWSVTGMLVCLFAMRMAEAAGVRDGYTTPSFVIPYAFQKPVIDGKVDDREWAGAFSINALQPCGIPAVNGLQTRFWLMWNEENLYVAMRSPLRTGERLLQAIRRLDRPYNVVFDDSYEIFIDAKTKSPDGQPVYFQYLSNFASARYELMFEPAVGNWRPSWRSHWMPKNRITQDGKAWEMEMVIPRESIYQHTPFTEGSTLSALLARDFKRPWIQSSISGQSDFSVYKAYPRLTLSKTAPAVQLLSVGDPHAKTLGVQFAVSGNSDETLKWSFTSDGDVAKSGDITVNAGQYQILPSQLTLDKPGTGDMRIRVTSADGTRVYLDWATGRAFANAEANVIDANINDKGDVANLTIAVNPVHDYVRVTGDFIQFDERTRIARGELSLKDAAGKTVGAKTLQLDPLAYMEGVLTCGSLAPGKYTVQLNCVDQAGKSIVTQDTAFEKKDPVKSFPWWNTSRGNIEKVIDPWTPVTVFKNTIGMWGRTLTVGAAGLPAQIKTQNEQLLAAPVRLEATMADGKVITASSPKVTVVSKADHRIVMDVSSMLGDLQVTSRVTSEFDGMYRIEMKIDPRKATMVKALGLVVPMTPAASEYLHAAGEGIRTGYDARFLPTQDTGRLWDSTRIDGQNMVVGSFIPYIWIGNTHGGLSWYADNDQGWEPSNAVPAIEVRRVTQQSTDIVFNIISQDCTLDAPRTLTFAFHATPVKPLKKGWRMDTWWCDDTFRDFQQVSTHGGNLIWTNIPFTLDIPASKSLVDGKHKDGANSFPYFENNHIAAQYSPEMSYFNEEWKTSINNTLWFDKTLADYMVYNLSEWVKSCGIDGFYVDNVRPEPCSNIEAGRGYRLPDGRVQPTYQIFAVRTYYLRMRAAFIEASKNPPRIVLHTTNHFVAPWIGAADVVYDGEANVIYPESKSDFMDAWSLGRLRLDNGEQWGVIVNFMQEYQGNWFAPEMKERYAHAMRAYKGLTILHDALPTGNTTWSGELGDARKRFGIDADDVRFLPYWNNGTGLSCSAKDVYLAGWLRPQKLLLAVVNCGEQCTATLEIDTAKLGLPALNKCKIYDAETLAPLKLSANSKLTVAVPRHNYRQVVIEAKP